MTPNPTYLPRAREATIPREKLADYALSTSHERGRHKARVFASALGIGAEDWAYLRDRIAEAVVSAPIRSTRITPFGVAYELVLAIDGLNGATHAVVTTWIAEPSAAPRLTSTWVDIP